MDENKSILVALSGGIDSSVAAFLLKKQGYKVSGIHFRLVDEKHSETFQQINGQGNQNPERNLEMIAQKIDIPLYEIDYREKFEQTVIDYFVRAYQQGITPNPCVLCNSRIKFHLLFDYAQRKNIQSIATGHYARLGWDSNKQKYLLKKGLDTNKDQSYFLYGLNQTILSRCVFPLGFLNKDEVGNIAHEIGLDIFKIKESQEICFIPENNYRRFIEKYKESALKPGYFIDTSGEILGRHKGIAFYTIGQRRKTGLSLNRRKYIVHIDAPKNRIVIGDEKDLYRNECWVSQIHLISIDKIEKPLKIKVQIRYNTTPAQATVSPDQNGKLHILFDQPQRAIAPGQSAVFYDEDTVIGGGIVCGF